MSLPPFPEPYSYPRGDYFFNAEQMQAYGQACREAALGQAAKAIVEPIGHDDYTAMRQAAEKIRSWK